MQALLLPASLAKCKIFPGHFNGGAFESFYSEILLGRPATRSGLPRLSAQCKQIQNHHIFKLEPIGSNFGKTNWHVMDNTPNILSVLAPHAKPKQPLVRHHRLTRLRLPGCAHGLTRKRTDKFQSQRYLETLWADPETF